ncbi:Mis12-domain-containing protein [Xylona heveae TC161]|uniref:Mis12-domain-containing protein n=1 Tax=Xylona heveae (strain CBS 132557 / TC161) TaxID=1328760 RepID=A0A165HX16_XYLHT|nr:Mis12-domain-containing protein [Xylona heveae TC161]KZF24044.1 Mis12-domain-containing protein [Xylona heveae TC161]
MSKQNSEATSLLTEHLRYTPLSLIDDIINAMNTLIYHAVSSVENGLLSTSPEVLGFGNSGAGADSIPDTDGDGNVVYPEAKLEIENGVHQLETLLESAVDKDFDKLEIYTLRSILSVPEELVPWVRLAHYEGLSFNSPSTATAESDSPTPESINLQRRKLRETQKLHAALLQEREQNALIIEQLRALRSGTLPVPSTSSSSSSSNLSSNLKTEPQSLENTKKPSDTQQQQSLISPFSFLFNAPSAQALGVGATSASTSLPAPASTSSLSASTSSALPSSSSSGPSRPSPLATNAEFLISQLSALRTALDNLRPRLSSSSAPSSYPPPSSAAADDHAAAAQRPTSRAARTQYIESQTRRHMQRTARMDLDDQGAPRHGGEYQRPGRKIDPDEVRSLETFAGVLRGAGAGAGAEGGGGGAGVGGGITSHSPSGGSGSGGEIDSGNPNGRSGQNDGDVEMSNTDTSAPTAIDTHADGDASTT